MSRNIELASFESIKGKNVLITGATGGIGQTIAKGFNKLGANCILTGRNEEKLNNLKSQLSGNSIVKTCDISNADNLNIFCDEIIKDVGSIDILILNAGITKDGLLMRMSENDWDSVLNTNLKSAFILTKKLLRPMMKNRWGRIIAISSVVGQGGNAGQANYVSSKAGLIGFTKSVAQEIATRGITCNAITPGFIKTEMTDVLTEDQKQAITSNIPMGEYGSPEDIANASVFLASDMASYITGSVINVNGGMYM